MSLYSSDVASSSPSIQDPDFENIKDAKWDNPGSWGSKASNEEVDVLSVALKGDAILIIVDQSHLICPN